MAGYDEPMIALAMLYHSKHDGVLERVFEEHRAIMFQKGIV
jgi:hypothetical protein